MTKLKKILLLFTGLFSIGIFALNACFRKKGEPKNIESWLDRHMPGQLQVVNSNLKMLDVMAQFKGEKQALVADQHNQEIQFLLDWEKDSSDLGLNKSYIEDQLAYAREGYRKSTELYQQFASAGLEKVAVGVHHLNIYVQYYAEPGPEERENFRKAVLQVMNQWIKTDGYTLYFQIMEPSAYHTKLKNIIPAGHFLTENGWQQEHEILSLSIYWRDIKAESWNWDINTASLRGQAITDQAFEKASEWAQKHLPAGARLEEGKLIGFELIKHPDPAYQMADAHSPSIRISFPYTLDKKKTEEEEPDGFVTCVYVLDGQKIGQFKKEKEGTWGQ
jgi:hypothetical protein